MVAYPRQQKWKNAKADANGGKPRSSEEEVYALIIDDLNFAATHLDSKGIAEVGRVNKEAAQTLLGKVYLTKKIIPMPKLPCSP